MCVCVGIHMNVDIQGSQERVSDSLELKLLVAEHSPLVLGPNLGPLEKHAILMADGPSLQSLPLPCRLSDPARAEASQSITKIRVLTMSSGDGHVFKMQQT